MKLGIVSNPASQRNRRGLDGFREAAAAFPDVRHEILGGMADLPAVLADFAADGIGLVAVNGGDGTVQAVMTELIRRRPFPELPCLAVFPGGMTNMIADDVGLAGRPRKALARLAACAASDGVADMTLTRRTVALTAAPDRDPVYGMFFGAGAIYRAIEVCRRVVHPMRFEGAAAGLTMAGLLVRRAFGSGRGDEVFRGDEISLRVDGGEARPGSRLMVLATTLDRLLLGSRPFWGEGGGGLRFTSVAYPPVRFARSLYRLLYGSAPRRLPEESYQSWNADQVELLLDCPFTLDGELFEPEPGQPVTLAAGPAIRFVRC